MPDFFELLLIAVLGVAALYFSGLWGLILSLGNSTEEQAAKLLSYFISNPVNIVKAVTGVIAFAVTTFFIGASLQVVKFKMFKDLINKKKISFIRSFAPANKEYYWQFIGVKIAIFLTFILGLIIAAAIGILSSLASKTVGEVIFILLLIVIVVYLFLMIFFIYPIMFIMGKGISETFKISFKFSRRNIKNVLMTLLIMLLTLIAINFVVSWIITPFEDYFALGIVISSLLLLIPGVWASYFTFAVYKTVK